MSKSAYQYKFADSDADQTRYEILSTSDNYYTNLYSYIGRIANPALSQLKTASGSDATKNALKAEALTIRAYCHFMLLQKFAKAYDPSTAANDPGIVYMTEDDDISTPQPKKTVQEAYDLCLKDINEAIDLNAMPATASTVYRPNKAAMYAVKALICLSMQNYADAEDAANAALAINNNLYDYYANVSTAAGYAGEPYQTSTVSAEKNPESYFVIPDYAYFQWVQPEVASKFEDGYATYFLFPTMDKLYKGIGKVMPAYAAYEDYGGTIGLPGWDASQSFDVYTDDSGLNSPMMYFVLAECELKNGSVDKAMGYLDQVRAKRLPSDTYKPLQGTVTSKSDAIEHFKNDYIAENIWTPWVFIGRKRWNVNPEWRETLTRTIAGTTYTLAPTSSLWVFPFPGNVREANPNLTSNKNN